MDIQSGDGVERNSGAPPRPQRAGVHSESPDGVHAVHTVSFPFGVTLADLVGALATLPRDVTVETLADNGTGGQIVLVEELAR